MKKDFFNEEAFEKEVMADVKGKYGEENPCTIFFEALDKILGVAAPWQFDNIEAERDCWNFILPLANKAFSFIWGLKDEKGALLETDALDYAVGHLNDPDGCTTCGDQWNGCRWPDIEFKARQLGMQYYAILLKLKDTIETVDELV